MFNKLTNISKFYLLFFLILSLSFLLDLLSFNENFLIGGLFTIGFLVVFTLSRLNFTNLLTVELKKVINQFLIRQKLILIYRLVLAKSVYFNFVLYFKIRFKLIIFKYKMSFNMLLITLKNNRFKSIIFNIYFLNILSIYFYFENFILTQLWCNSINFSYLTLI